MHGSSLFRLEDFAPINIIIIISKLNFIIACITHQPCVCH